MALATLSIDLVAQLASLQQGMDKAGRLAERNAAQIEARYAKLSQVAAGVGAALAASFSAAGIVAFVRATVDGVDRLNDLADATGASIENLSALEDIGARTGTSIDTVGDAVLKLNKVLNEAKADSPIARQLQAIGLNAAELQKVDPAEALRRVSEALAGYADDGNKARLVQDLFGKSVREVAPFLKDLAEAGRLNATVTTQQAKEAEAFNNQLSQLSKNAQDLARGLTGPLVSALNELARQYRETVKEGGGFLLFLARQTELGRITGLVDVPQIDGDQLKQLRARQRELQLLLETPLGAGLKQRKAELEQVNADIERVLSGYLGSTAGAGRGSVNPRPVVPTIFGEDPTKPKTEKEKEIKPFVIKLDDTTLAALKRLEETDAQKVAALRLELQALTELRPEGGSVGSDEALARIVEELARIDPEAKKAAEAKERLDAILSQTPQGVLADVLTDIELINAAFDRGAIDAEQWAAAIRASASKLPQDFEKPLAEVSEFARQAGANIQDALGDTLLASMEGKFDSLDDLWKNLIKRMIAQAAAAQLGKYLLGNDFGTTGNVGGAVGQFFNWLGTLSGKAGGGPVQAGRPYIVGERRAELFVPQQSGTIVPDLGMLGGNTTNIYVQGDVSERNMKMIQRAIANERARSMRSI